MNDAAMMHTPTMQSATQTERIFIAGHRGMVGSGLIRALQKQNNGQLKNKLILRSHHELDLTDAAAVHRFFDHTAIDTVYLAAARVGGIQANHQYPAEFIYQNLQIAANVIHAAWRHGIKKLLFLGSSCIYPRLAPQPLREEYLLTGALEQTNEPYAVAKIAGIKLCESYNRQYGTDYRSIMPTNLYGPGDNYHAQNSHVMPALIRRFHEATQTNASLVTVWGSGQPQREFLYVDDMAAACIFLMQLSHDDYANLGSPQSAHVNVGSNEEISIHDLAHLVAEIVGYQGDIIFNTGQPDGAPRKLLDSSKLLHLGWQPEVGLREGIQRTVQHYLATISADYADLAYRRTSASAAPRLRT
jgi:GDP-L-fucose synthase